MSCPHIAPVPASVHPYTVRVHTDWAVIVEVPVDATDAVDAALRGAATVTGDVRRITVAPGHDPAGAVWARPPAQSTSAVVTVVYADRTALRLGLRRSVPSALAAVARAWCADPVHGAVIELAVDPATDDEADAVGVAYVHRVTP